MMREKKRYDSGGGRINLKRVDYLRVVSHFLSDILLTYGEKPYMEDYLEGVLKVLLETPLLNLENRGAIFLADQDSKTLFLKASHNFSPNQKRICNQIPFGRCLCGKAAESRKIVYLDSDEEGHEIFCKELSSHGHYCVPIVWGEELLGVLSLYVPKGHMRTTEEDIFLKSIATILASVLRIERSRAELEESEVLLRELTATTSAGIFICQGERFVYVNDACVEITGYSKEELFKIDFWSIVHPDYQGLVRKRELEKQQCEKMPKRYEFKIIRKDGEERWIELMVGRIKWKGKSAFIGTAFDITDRKRIEGQHSEQLDFLRYVIDSFGYPLFVMNANTYEVEWANEALLQGRKLLPGLTCYQLTHDIKEPCASIGCPCPLDTVKSTKKPVVLEHVHYDVNGREQILEVHTHPIFDEGGNVVSIYEFTIDVTSAKRLERALSSLAKSYAHLTGKEFLDAITVHIAETMNLDIVYIGELIPGKERIRVLSASEKSIEGVIYDLANTPCSNVVNKRLVVYPRDVQRIFPKDEALGEWGIQGYIGTPLFDPSRVPMGIMVGLSKRPMDDPKLIRKYFQVFVDRVTTELLRMRADRELYESEERFKLLAESSLTGIYLIQEGKFTYVNKALADIFGYEVDEVIGKLGPLDLTHPEDRPLVQKNIKLRISGEVESIRYEFRGLRKDGKTIYVEVHGRRILYRGKPGIIGTLLDITSRKITQQEIERSHRLLLTLSRSAQEVQRVRSPDEVYRVIGEQVKRLGYDATIFVLDEGEEYIRIVYTTLSPERQGICEEIFKEPVVGQRIPILPEGVFHRILNEGEAVFVTTEEGIEGHVKISGERHPKVYQMFKRLGWKNNIMAPLRTSERFYGLLAVSGEGITETDMGVITIFANQAAIAVENARLYHETRDLALFNKRIVENVADGIIVQDIEGIIKFVNPAGARMLGYKPEELVGKHWSFIVPEDQRSIVEAADLRREMGVSDRYELELLCGDGQRINVLVSGSPITDEKGNITGTMGVFTDITELKRAEKERVRLQEQLFQAQKLEAIGRLAGGVAHDFNNMLTAIMGHAEIGLTKIHPDNPVYTDLKEILDAAKRSAELTSKLLGFARKQPVTPKVIDLNTTISGMLSVLHRLIGEDIEIIWKPGSNLWQVRIDPTQVNQILANLVVNSKDAGAKTVIIETENIEIDDKHLGKHPYLILGEYVLIAVSDDGQGIDPEIMPKIFEPFFTTKEPGKGTGLGLSTVYGIVKQNKGYIHVYSEPGKGTTFKIYFPRFAVKEHKREIAGEPMLIHGQGETILLVEDEKQILEVLRIMLEHLGYRVITANRPSEALEKAKKYSDEVDLLLTDVVMPEMNGRQLASLITDINPNIRCIYMSGYTANHMANHGVLEEGVGFVTKPVNMRELAQKIRSVLHQMPQGDQS